MWNYYKSVISKSIGYTFQRMTLYLTLFNFTMLGFYVYDNTSIGDALKENGYRPGDIILMIVFAIFALSVLEYILIGKSNEKNTDK